MRLTESTDNQQVSKVDETYHATTDETIRRTPSGLGTLQAQSNEAVVQSIGTAKPPQAVVIRTSNSLV